MVKIVDNYTMTEVIGQGQYGKVYKATHIDTKMNVAIKCIKASKFREICKLTDCTSNEIETLMLIQDNINIIKFVEMIKTANHIYLIYEFCEGGNLDQEMRKSRFFSEKRALLYFKQLMNAFKTLSTYNILHRDIKPDNILIKSGHLKLADFGFCKRMASAEDLTQTVLGSPVYMAPQVLNGDLYNSKADIWSLGVVLYEMLFGFCPFNQGSLADFLKHIDTFRISIPTDVNQISSVTQGLLRRMLEKDPFRRISWQDLFYEYEVTEYGILTRKQKGFEYDLMKLMKKNSYNQPAEQKQPKTSNFKFNWSKIADGKSSVKSDELNEEQKSGDLDKIFGLKRKIKQFSTEHTKCMLASAVLTEVLKNKLSQATQFIAYQICSTIRNTLSQLKKNIDDFRYSNVVQLQLNAPENQQIKRLVGVLREQEDTVIPNLNALKVMLLSSDVKSLKPDNKHIRKNVQKYLNDVVEKHPHCASFENTESDKSMTAHLARVLTTLNFDKLSEPINITDTMDKISLVKVLHSRKRQFDI